MPRRTRQDKEPCGKCKSTVAVNARALDCDGCKMWYHIGCAPVSEKFYKLINADEPNIEGVKWFCKKCLPSLDNFEQIKLAQQQLDDKMDTLHQLMTRLEKKDEEFDKRVEKFENVIEERVDKLFNERCDQERKRLNMIIHGLAESKEKDPIDRKNSDTTDVKNVAKLLDVQVTITSSLRLGSKKDDKVRPLKVVLGSTREKGNLLRASKQLRKVQGKYKLVFINPDLTQNERNKDKALVDDLKEKRKKYPDKTLRISKGRIVEIRKKPNAGRTTKRKANTDRVDNSDDSEDDQTPKNE